MPPPERGATATRRLLAQTHCAFIQVAQSEECRQIVTRSELLLALEECCAEFTSGDFTEAQQRDSPFFVRYQEYRHGTASCADEWMLSEFLLLEEKFSLNRPLVRLSVCVGDEPFGESEIRLECNSESRLDKAKLRLSICSFIRAVVFPLIRELLLEQEKQITASASAVCNACRLLFLLQDYEAARRLLCNCFTEEMHHLRLICSFMTCNCSGKKILQFVAHVEPGSPLLLTAAVFYLSVESSLQKKIAFFEHLLSRLEGGFAAGFYWWLHEAFLRLGFHRKAALYGFAAGDLFLPHPIGKSLLEKSRSLLSEKKFSVPISALLSVESLQRDLAFPIHPFVVDLANRRKIGKCTLRRETSSFTIESFEGARKKIFLNDQVLLKMNHSYISSEYVVSLIWNNQSKSVIKQGPTQSQVSLLALVSGDWQLRAVELSLAAGDSKFVFWSSKFSFSFQVCSRHRTYSVLQLSEPPKSAYSGELFEVSFEIRSLVPTAVAGVEVLVNGSPRKEVVSSWPLTRVLSLEAQRERWEIVFLVEDEEYRFDYFIPILSPIERISFAVEKNLLKVAISSNIPDIFFGLHSIESPLIDGQPFSSEGGRFAFLLDAKRSKGYFDELQLRVVDFFKSRSGRLEEISYGSLSVRWAFAGRRGLARFCLDFGYPLRRFFYYTLARHNLLDCCNLLPFSGQPASPILISLEQVEDISKGLHLIVLRALSIFPSQLTISLSLVDIGTDPFLIGPLFFSAALAPFESFFCRTFSRQIHSGSRNIRCQFTAHDPNFPEFFKNDTYAESIAIAG